ncbi:MULTISPECIES: hypothetical protein [unclassified Amycolatopsis]|uniref:hypothetical protein n=1 Tax=unclassified Amycolatopsis TaxID=2618356 RepID=UPI002E12B0A4|nr:MULTISPECIES: hypothetical protein [unclassified Amycolatopsis]WSJ78824.1 hypothetical protein OG439_07495 [Amycolatopsis sp. NBC_01307]WSK77605.1 hypothetical protein OG570_40570 [Amycolatopsis sp. NBC_01286]
MRALFSSLVPADHTYPLILLAAVAGNEVRFAASEGVYARTPSPGEVARIMTGYAPGR